MMLFENPLITTFFSNFEISYLFNLNIDTYTKPIYHPVSSTTGHGYIIDRES